MSRIREIEKWAAKVWQQNVKGWEERNQDLNYRQLLARPTLKKALKNLAPVEDGIFLDLGCGDGSEMRQIHSFLIKQGNQGILYGFDFQKTLIAIARQSIPQVSPIGMIVDSGQTKTLINKHSLIGKVDRIFCTFLLQELSDARSFCQEMSSCLKPAGLALVLLLHPAFGKAMFDKGAARINQALSSKQFRWAAEFPIVEENGHTFYVPYFHRKMDDYLKLLRQYFSSVRVMAEAAPSKAVIKKAQRKRLSPFYAHPGNVYYPEILQVPSSLVFQLEK